MNKRIVILLTAMTAGILHADSVTYTISPEAGQFLYQFTLANTGDTGGTLFDLFVSLATDIGNIETSNIGTPIGWGDPTSGLLFFGPDTGPGTAFVEWSDGGPLYDSGIGSSLSGFSFDSSLNISQPILFALNGSTDLFPAQEQSTAPTPEPGTLGQLLVGVLAGIGWLVRLRATQQATRTTG